jgi:hypothetical protein
MTPADWKQFLQELRDLGYGDEVAKFEKAEKEVEAEYQAQKVNAAKIIEHSKLVELVNNARKEGRIVHYFDRNGQNIIH